MAPISFTKDFGATESFREKASWLGVLTAMKETSRKECSTAMENCSCHRVFSLANLSVTGPRVKEL